MIHSKFWQTFFALAPIVMLFLMLVGYIIFMISIFSHLPELEHSQTDPPFYIFGGLGIFLVLLFLVVALSFGSLIFYIVHAVQNPNLKVNNLLLIWILLFVFANGLGQLIYWIIEIVNKRGNQLTPA